MQEIRKIIVPVDFQQYTEELTEYAMGIAKKVNAEVVFFHVVENVVYYADFIPTNFALNEEETFSHAKKKMSALVEKCKQTWTQCTGEVSKGDVVDIILAHIQDEGIDLIVMGTHGARGIEKILLGSVAERVIQQAKCPILVFKSPQQ